MPFSISALKDSAQSFVKNTVSSMLPINALGAKNHLRYLPDGANHQNVIKFEAIGRMKKSSVLDFRVAKFASQSLGSVTLYMPANLTVADTLSYDNADTGAGGELMKAGGSAGSFGEAAGTLKDQSKGIMQTATASAVASVSQSKGMLGGAAAQATIERGEVVNPHTQMLFKAPALRQFQFNFKMMPRSRKEAEDCVSIVRFFRVCAYPELATPSTGTESVNMSTFLFPDLFKITYMTNGRENKHLIKIMESYLTSVTVNYNATSPSFFDDGMPSEIDLALTFQESKAINRNLIVEKKV